MLDKKKLDIPKIMACQQNRYPMLFLDSVTDYEPNKFAKGFKLFSYNEWYFHGYETNSPKVWNVIQIEAMSQLFLMTFLTNDKYSGQIAVSNKFKNVNFFRKIIPGEKLEMIAFLNSFKNGIASGKVEGYVGEHLACSMECTIVLPEIFSKNQGLLPKSSKCNFKKEMIYEKKVEFGIDQIKNCLLNKYPWLFIDDVWDIDPGKSVHAVKNFTYNESYFPTHFPGDPSVPGFIQIECCIQSFLLTFLSLDENKRSETADRLIHKVQIQNKIVPGDTLHMFSKLDKFSRGIAKGSVNSIVNGKKAVSLEVTVVIPEQLKQFKPGKK